MTQWGNKENVVAFRGEEKHYHCVYRVNFPDGMEYTGKHSTVDLEEPYHGSGVELKDHYEKVGYKGIEITRLSFHWTREDVILAENKILTPEYRDLPHVLNKRGGVVPPHEDPSTFKKKAKEMIKINNRLRKENKELKKELESKNSQLQRVSLKEADNFACFRRVEDKKDKLEELVKQFKIKPPSSTLGNRMAKLEKQFKKRGKTIEKLNHQIHELKK